VSREEGTAQAGLPPCFGRTDCRPARGYCCVLFVACGLDRELSAISPEDAAKCRAGLLVTLTRKDREDLGLVEGLRCPHCPKEAETYEELAAHIFLYHDSGAAVREGG
jgi:hypothetical protein